jgi:hypothetical protein
MPRRRRGARSVAVEPDAGRGLVMRILLHSPKDMVAGALAFAAVSAIIANALFLQAGRHPSPMFGSVVAMPAASPLPRPRPVEADASVSEPKPAEPKSAEPKSAEPRLADPKPAESKLADPLANLVKATTSAPPVAPSNIARPPAPIPVSPRNDAIANLASGSRRVAAVQRALTEYGYGQLKPTGTVGSDKIPVTGQMSDRLVRELTTMIGHPID